MDCEFLSGPSRIEEFFKNNQAPSDEVDQEVKRLLLRPKKDLELLDIEILDLKNRLSGLESNRNEIQKQISRYELILAPIRRIPADVLREIFYCCPPTHRNPIMKSSDSPLLLTHVCSPWRAVALSSPRLWERLYVTFADDDTVPDLDSAAEMVRNGEIMPREWTTAQPKSKKERTTELLRRRIEATKEWLLRSGTRPLSLSICHTSVWWYDTPFSERLSGGNITMEILSLLTTLAPRLRDLELKTSSLMNESLEQMVTVSEMEMLSSLRIVYPRRLSSRTDGARIPTLLEAPNLRQLSMSPCVTTLSISDPSFKCQWNKFTKISCHRPLSIADTIFLLGQSSNLVHYKGAIVGGQDTDFPSLYKGRISLPSLRTLDIGEISVSPQRPGNIYDRIDAPILQWFGYYNSRGRRGFSTDNPAPLSILALLSKSTQLQKLSFDVGNDINTWNLGTLLVVVPTITHLVLGQELKSNNDPPTGRRRIPTQVPDLPYNQSGFSNPSSQPCIYDDLIVGNPCKANVPPLLPRLTSLVVSGKATARLCDDTLLSLIKSRMVSNETATLENVRVTFDREKGRDIMEDVTRYANHIGVKIDLELDYPSAPYPHESHLSPDFDLNGADSTWRYLDAGETWSTSY